jgi:acetyl-CoA carboxylase/biotin carboxylase 1
MIEDVEKSGGLVPQDIYDQACVVDWEGGLAVAKRIGLPIMIKASEGGGGKGIRKVESLNDFPAAFQQVQTEVPGSPIFIMAMASNVRHLEVQILADEWGSVISLFGRDCSVQRRHQKIIEEAPVSIAPEHILRAMESAAVRLAQIVGYQGAGTVEYLFDPTSQQFYFLELNPRLQVEHPCTEMVTGVNLPAAQLQVAMGIPLAQFQDTVSIGAFLKKEIVSPRGYVVAARITAENPDIGFKPNSGKVEDMTFHCNANVWGYFAVNSSGCLHEYADSQFGHIFSFGETRELARRNLVVALKELSIRADFRTTIEYLVRLLEIEEFVSNRISTNWLDQLIERKIRSIPPDFCTAIVVGSTIKALKEQDSRSVEFESGVKRGQVLSTTMLSCASRFTVFYNDKMIKVEAYRAGPDLMYIEVNSSSLLVRCRVLNDGGFLVTVGCKTYTVYANEDVDGLRLNIDGRTAILENESDPSKLRSPSPGKLVRYLVDDQSYIKAGSMFAEIEVGKAACCLSSYRPE